MTSAFEQAVRVLAARVMGETTVEYNARPDWLIGLKGKPLELDIYYPNAAFAIECNGDQHSKPGLTSRRQVGKLIERDEIKARLCRENCVRLIVVLPKELKNESKLETRILEALRE